MTKSQIVGVMVLLASGVGCGGTIALPTPTSSPTQTPTVTRTPTVTLTPRPTATPTVTPTLGAGANIGFFGVLMGQGTLLDPSGSDALGRPIYERPIGSGFVIVVEAKPGTNGAPVGDSSFDSDSEDPSIRPDLQIEVNRDLGDGSTTVCDNERGNFGGVPGIEVPSFEETQEISDALNDFGCRFIDGSGNTRGRTDLEPCVLFPDGEFYFVDPSTTTQFCATISQPMSFPLGDTVVTARVRDQSQMVGPDQQIVIRVGSPPTAPPKGTP